MAVRSPDSQNVARAWLERDPAALDAELANSRTAGSCGVWIEVAALSTRLSGEMESPLLAELRARCPSLRSPVVPPLSATVLTGRRG